MRFEASQSALVRQIKRATLTSYTSDSETADLHKGELPSGANIFYRYAKYNYGQCIGVPLRAMMAYQRRVTVKLDASLNLDTTWRYLISFIPRSHYPLPQGKEPPVPTAKEVGRVPEQVWKLLSTRISCTCQESKCDSLAV
jgi:hypothetical protein